MKTLHLGIIVGLFTMTFCLVSSPHIHAIPPISPQEEYSNSDTIIIGKIIGAVPFSSTYMKYDVHVEQYLKNPQSKDKITVIAEGTNKTQVEQGRAPDTVFDVGDRALLFLKQDDKGNNVAWWFSHHTDFLCEPAPTQDDLNSSFPNAKFSNVPTYSQLRIGATNASSYVFQTSQPVVISFDTWNKHFTNQTFDVMFDIKNETNNKVVFHDVKQVQLKACVGHQTVSTSFIPKTHGMYEADVSFDNTGIGTTFQILDAFSSVSLDSVPISSPLKQIMSGVMSKDVQCWEGLQLIFKSEDDSPACVKLDTAQKLIERGWGMSSIPSIHNVSNQEKNGTLSGVVSAFVYGGPLGSSQNQSVHYEVDVYATDGMTIIGKTFSDYNAHYSLQLPTGNYIIYTYNATTQTHLVSVYAGKNTVFNISSIMSVP